MPLPDAFNFKQPIDVPEAAEDLAYIHGVAQVAFGEVKEGLVMATLGVGEDEVRITPNAEGGFSLAVGSVMGNREAMEQGEGYSVSKTLVFDGLLHVIRATIEVGTELPGDELVVSTKRIPPAGLKSFIGSIATTVSKHL